MLDSRKIQNLNANVKIKINYYFFQEKFISNYILILKLEKINPSKPAFKVT